MNCSKGSHIIPCYYRKSDSRAPNPFGKGFDPSGWISQVIMEVRPHLDLATFTPLKIFLWPGLLSRGVNVCCSVLNSEVYENMDSTTKQENAKIINKDMWFIYNILKPLVSKFRNITRLILGLIQVPNGVVKL